MQTGFSTLVTKDTSVDEFVTNAKSMFLVLLEEGMRSAGNYAKASGRDVVTQEDILYGLQFQAHQFQNIQNIQERSKEAITAWESTEKEFKSKSLVFADGDEKWNIFITHGCLDVNDYVWKGVISNDSQNYDFELRYQCLGEGECEMECDIPDETAEKILDFLFEELVEKFSDDESIDDSVENHEPFKRAPDSHSEQIALMNFYHDHWNEWEPETDVEKLLKETIDTKLTEITPSP